MQWTSSYYYHRRSYSLLYTYGTVHCHVVASKFNCVNFKMLLDLRYLLMYHAGAAVPQMYAEPSHAYERKWRARTYHARYGTVHATELKSSSCMLFKRLLIIYIIPFSLLLIYKYLFWVIQSRYLYSVVWDAGVVLAWEQCMLQKWTLCSSKSSVFPKPACVAIAFFIFLGYRVRPHWVLLFTWTCSSCSGVCATEIGQSSGVCFPGLVHHQRKSIIYWK